MAFECLYCAVLRKAKLRHLVYIRKYTIDVISCSNLFNSRILIVVQAKQVFRAYFNRIYSSSSL
jgi:hypothetical protein